MARLTPIAALVCLLAAAAPAAPYGTPRQYYGTWHKHPTANYHYRTYYFKPTVSYAGYRHHYVVFSPARPKHLYFYNPYTKRYWGRCPVKGDGKEAYSLLAERDRKASLDEIPETAFPAPAKMPSIPDATGADAPPMDLPPDDLPAADGLPKGA